MRKYDYKTLFNELYDYYVEYGDNDASWTHIIRTLEKKGWISCQLHSSKLYYGLYDDAYAYIVSSIPNAFRSYDSESKASIYTWCTRLITQSIWRYIRDRVKQDRLEGYTTDDFTEYDSSHSKQSVEDEYIKNEDKVNSTDTLEYILRTVLRNEIYFDIYSLKKGLWGCENISRAEDIAERLNVTLKTVNQAVVDNKIRISILKRWMKENNNDITLLNRDSFEEYRYNYLYKKNK